MERSDVWTAIDGHRRALARLLEDLSEEEWQRPSLCESWTVRQVAAHLALQKTTWSMIPRAVLGLVRHGGMDGAIHAMACSHAELPVAVLVGEIRDRIGVWRPLPTVTFRETAIDYLVHGQDIAVPLGRTLEMPPELAVVAADRVWSCSRMFHARKKLAGYRLVANDAPWAAGQGQEVCGPIGALLLLLTGRPAVLPQLSGPGTAGLRVLLPSRFLSGPAVAVTAPPRLAELSSAPVGVEDNESGLPPGACAAQWWTSVGGGAEDGGGRTATPGGEMFGIRAGKAFDGQRSLPGGALVLVADGLIAGVRPGTAPTPEGCEVLEVLDGTVLPGLVDAHVHLCADGTDGTLDRIGEPSQDAMVAVIEQSLRRHLAAGVTTVRDLGDRRFAVLDWRSSARSGSGVYPAVVAAGPPITSVGGHCANMGGEAADQDQLRAAVRERAERGADAVKIMASGGFATAGTQVMACQFTLHELRVAVEEAHVAGLPVTAHAHGLPAVHMAMAAGVDGIEHCSFLTDTGISQSEQDLARLAAAGTAVCPTVGIAGTLVPPPNAVATLGTLGMTMGQMIEARKRRVAQMHAAGVRLVSGSDGGIAAAKPHGLLPVSVAFLVDGGVSTAAALASATTLAADACGLGDKKGRLRAGYDADLLVVDGDPVADIGALARPVAVFAAGRRPTRA